MTSFFHYLVLIISVFICLTNANSDTDHRHRVVGGYRPEKQTLAKHIVSVRVAAVDLLTGVGTGFGCAGVILAPNKILTTVTCVKPSMKLSAFEPGDLYVIAGSSKRLDVQKNQTQYSAVIQIITHKDFQRTGLEVMTHNIAILFLEKNIVEDGLTAERISLVTKRPDIGTSCISFGWGHILNDGIMAANLFYTDLEIISNTQCRRRQKQALWRYLLNLHLFNIRKSTLCASDTGDLRPYSGMCDGDEGGPLICNDQLAGILSFTMVPCGLYPYNVYLNVFYYRHWIDNIENRALMLDVVIGIKLIAIVTVVVFVFL